MQIAGGGFAPFTIDPTEYNKGFTQKAAAAMNFARQRRQLYSK
jgi:hypothetical protein